MQTADSGGALHALKEGLQVGGAFQVKGRKAAAASVISSSSDIEIVMLIIYKVTPAKQLHNCCS